MAKKITGWKTKGMNRDMSVSAFNPEFAFENKNLRLTTNENNTTMSWVNEKGTLSLSIVNESGSSFSMTGMAIGAAVLNSYLIVFTTLNAEDIHAKAKTDYIYRLKYDSARNRMVCKTLFNGNLNFSTLSPLETLPSFESDTIQKVYWTDGRNQPRLINIMNETKLGIYNAQAGSDPVSFFDFVPAIGLKEKVIIINKPSTGGLFAPGVIQYCFTYVNRCCQQSNVVYISPLYYLAFKDRGASPEEKVTNTFHISISNLDKKFDYVRLYSIQRTSLNAVPIVKLLEDLPIDTNAENPRVSYIDRGINGASVDPTELLFIGGKEIVALTMADKDNTLFLGNITQKNILVNDIQDWYDSHKQTIEYKCDEIDEEYDPVDYPKIQALDTPSGIYTNTHQLKDSRRKITTFKGGETYRFGIQLQKYTGEWSEPIFIDDVENTLYPLTAVRSNQMSLVYAKSDAFNISAIDRSVYKKIRPIVVYPTIGDRTVLCQGVLNPTVFNVEDRCSSSPYAQASWFFRPYAFETAGESKKLDILVTRHKYQGESTDPDDAFKDKVNPVYILVAKMSSAEVQPILQRKYVRVEEWTKFHNAVNQSKITNYPFIGAVDLGTLSPGSGWHYYAFVSSNPWPREEEINPSAENPSYGPDEGHGIRYLDKMDNVYLCENPFQLYDKIKVSDPDHYLFYKQYYDLEHTTSLDPYYIYHFRFVVSIENDIESPVFYDVVFTSMGTDNDSDDYSFENNGTAPAFTHYETIPMQTMDYKDNVDEDGNPKIRPASEYKRIEVQGSRMTFTSPYAEKEMLEGVRDNTQFFIDQSIVTLNSPDIDFDTEVQTYGFENLSLRVIGAIPITATTCSHSITISGSMLESGYNTENPIASFGKGELKNTVLYKNINVNAGKRLISDYLWNDAVVLSEPEKEDKIRTAAIVDTAIPSYMVYPWQKSGSLNNDFRSSDEASSVLNTKIEAAMHYSANTEYFSHYNVTEGLNIDVHPKKVDYVEFPKVSAQIALTENAEVFNYKLAKQRDDLSDINYFPNVDTILYPRFSQVPLTNFVPVENKTTLDLGKSQGPVSMKYKSTSHMVLALHEDVHEGAPDGHISILPCPYIGNNWKGEFNNPDPAASKTFWGDKNMLFYQTHLDTSDMFPEYSQAQDKGYNILWLGELHKHVDKDSRFGGKGKEAYRSNNWVVGGDAVDIPSSSNTVKLVWTEGDTFFQRYDCLKTYPFTNEDPNQLIEILSFMCETHVNIDGRYDRNRGQVNNNYMSPKDFNLLNIVYSQEDNFFEYKDIDHFEDDATRYPNMFTWSKTKILGADVDLWTNVTLASTEALDGDKGELNSFQRFNNQIIAFQDSGISQILYNENVQIESQNGVPIEIANSNKYLGKRYFSNTVGCTNKWSIAQTPMGIYFMDSNDRSIYRFNGELDNLSARLGMNTWTKEMLNEYRDIWTPDNYNGFVSYYDRQNQDVLFINNDTALAFSEKAGVFTSFYDYGKTPYLCNIENNSLWLRYYRDSSNILHTGVWKHNAGNYCNFFGTQHPFSMTLVGNPEPQMDKIFTNLEFRASVDGEGTVSGDDFTPYLPFNSLETWNEYQHGITTLNIRNGHDAFKHHDGSVSSLKRKFRIWRCDIPRDNAALALDEGLNIKRFSTHPIDRMRNPWIYLKLQKSTAGSNLRTEVHDILMTYFD